MARRLNLQSSLQALVGPRTDGKQNVYYQPPESVKLNYPCIVYKRSRPNITYADNNAYSFTQCYEVTLISKDPDWVLPEEMVKQFVHCSIDRYFVSDNLYHNVLTLYY